MNNDQEAQFGILELIAPLIEAWWVILLVPLIVGSAAYFASRPVVDYYETSLLVAAPIRVSDLGKPAAIANKGVDSPPVVSVSPGALPGTTSIVIRAKSADAADVAARNIASYTKGLFDPSSMRRQELQLQLATHEESVATLRNAMRQIESALSEGKFSTNESGEDMASYAAAVAQLTRELQAQELARIRVNSQIGALPSGNVVSIALPAEPIMRSRSAVVPFAVLAALLMTIFAIGVKEAVARAVRSHPESAGLKRIRRVLPKWATR